MKGVVRITLSRPERGNAIDGRAARSIAQAFRNAGRSKSSRLVLLSGEGRHFCTGADLGWMAGARSLSTSRNRADAALLAEMYDAILSCDLPILARIHGRASGGGVGLAAACDIAACTKDAVFRLPEASLGLVPGVLSPILMRRIGYTRFVELALSGREVKAAEAAGIGLVAFTGTASSVDRFLDACVKSILEADPGAIRKIKASARALEPIRTGSLREMAFLTAQMRVRAEAQARLRPWQGSPRNPRGSA